MGVGAYYGNYETYTAATKRGSESSFLMRISSTPLPYLFLLLLCDDNYIASSSPQYGMYHTNKMTSNVQCTRRYYLPGLIDR